MFRNRFRKNSNTKLYEDIHYSCTVRFLDDSDPISISFQKDTDGQWLLQHVCQQLNLVERDYFGLRFVDADRQRHWLDPYKSVSRQLKNVTPLVLCFRVKFYPTDPLKLKEEITRYFLFLQLRRDLHHGRLLCSPTDANILAAYIVQAELGDYEDQNYSINDSPTEVCSKEEGVASTTSESTSSSFAYVGQLKMLSKQTRKQEQQISEIHKTFAGQVPATAEENFLKKASQLDTYGIDPHPVKQQKGTDMYLGVTHLGIVTYHGSKRTNLFKWCNITKLAFEGKMFIVHITLQQKKHACGFKCSSYQACKHLWKCANEQKYFFTLQCSYDIPKVISGGGFFSRGAKFRFSGRCQNEVYMDSTRIHRREPLFQRQNSNASLPHSVISHSTTLPITLQNANNSPDKPGHVSMIDVAGVTSRELNGVAGGGGGPLMCELRTPAYSEETIAEADEDQKRFLQIDVNNPEEVSPCDPPTPIPLIGEDSNCSPKFPSSYSATPCAGNSASPALTTGATDESDSPTSANPPQFRERAVDIAPIRVHCGTTGPPGGGGGGLSPLIDQEDESTRKEDLLTSATVRALADMTSPSPDAQYSDDPMTLRMTSEPAGELDPVVDPIVPSDLLNSDLLKSPVVGDYLKESETVAPMNKVTAFQSKMMTNLNKTEYSAGSPARNSRKMMVIAGGVTLVAVFGAMYSDWSSAATLVENFGTNIANYASSWF